MKRCALLLVLVLTASVTTSAHFVFVVPDIEHNTTLAVLSENLFADAEVDIATIAGLTLSFRDPSGSETAMKLVKGKTEYTAPLPGRVGLIHGMVDLGLATRGEVAHVLRYYPKTILGDPFSGLAMLPASPVELVPLRSDGALRLKFLVRGKPQPDAEVTVLFPGHGEKAMKTDATGRTEALPGRGMFGAWARYWEDAPGERQGKKYAQIRHYATVVFDSTAAPQAGSIAAAPATRVTTLPEPTSSFGAAESDGWLYVYGGHIAPTHVYNTSAVSGRFNRFNLRDRKTWEALPAGPALQGMNLLAHRGKIYRVGGMRPHNEPGSPDDVHSIADVARYDPATRQWEALPPLPNPRSSHDVVAVGDQLLVVGGWSLDGKRGTKWPEGMDVLDLGAQPLTWKRIPQPFKRRALIAAAHDGKLFAIGGFNERSQVVRATSIYDVARGTWSEGPELPGEGTNGFGPAACIMDGWLYVSMGDGNLYRLDSPGRAWERVGAATPRIVHRLIARDGEVLSIGGAAKGLNLDLVEAIHIGK